MRYATIVTHLFFLFVFATLPNNAIGMPPGMTPPPTEGAGPPPPAPAAAPTTPAPAVMPTPTSTPTPPPATTTPAPAAVPEEIKYELELSSEEESIIKGDVKMRKKWFSEANEYNRKITVLVNKIEEEIGGLHETKDELDTELDLFHNTINPLLGGLQKTADVVSAYLATEETSSPELETLKATFKTFDKDRQDLRLKVEETATLEQSLLSLLSLSDHNRSKAAKASVEAGKIKRKILDAQDDATAKGHRDKVIQAYGGIEQTANSTQDAKKAITKQVEKIKTQKDEVTKKGEELKTLAQNMNTQLEKIGNAQALAAEKEEIALAKTIEDEMQEQAKMETLAKEEARIAAKLQWYEKIVAWVANGIIWIRDWIRDLIGIPTKQPAKKISQTQTDVTTTGTVVEQIEEKIKLLQRKKEYAVQVQEKLSSIASQRQELIKELEAKDIELTKDLKTEKEKETVTGLLKNMVSTLGKLFKNLFHKVGRTINRLLEHGSTIGRDRPDRKDEPVSEEPEPTTPEAPLETEEVTQEVAPAEEFVPESPPEAAPAEETEALPPGMQAPPLAEATAEEFVPEAPPEVAPAEEAEALPPGMQAPPGPPGL